MLARLLRRLVKYYDPDAQRTIAGLQDDLRVEKQAHQLTKDRLARSEADVEHLVAWRDVQMAKLAREAAIQRAGAVVATEMPERE